MKDESGYLITDEANILNKFRTNFKDLTNINLDNDGIEREKITCYTIKYNQRFLKSL